MGTEEKVLIRKPSSEEIQKLGVFNWPVWEKEESEFDWYYPEDETFYVVEGEAEVELEDGSRVHFGKGDLVTFKKGVRCVWRILKPIRKHYR